MRILISIDDTDNLESRGTGWRSRMLAKFIESETDSKIIGITRHQLFVHPEIPYTSHNSSACLELESQEDIHHLIALSRSFMLTEAVEGSDVGLCVIPFDMVTNEIIEWGKNAKSIILQMEDAYDLAKNIGFHLEGLTGTKCGIIGALAAVGLRKSGNDGRYLLIGPKDFRDYSGIVEVSELRKMSGISIVCDKESNIFASESEKVFVGDWMRPVLQNHVPTLFADKVDNTDYDWIAADKEFVKSISN